MSTQLRGLDPGADMVARTDGLLARATALRERCESLAARLEEMAEASPARPSRVRAEPAEAMRLVATNLAVSGASREQIDERLRAEFGRADNSALVDEVLAATAAKRGPGRFTRRLRVRR